MSQILQKNTKNAPVLRDKAKEVPLKDIASAKTQKVLKDMKKALDGEEDGVALAAPQIGVSLRIFIVSKKVFSADEKNPSKNEHLVYINPEIKSLSKQKDYVDEGCLSVRWFYGDVERAEKATVRAYDEHGKPFERGGSGLLAQIFQHEIDHLDGILFTDKAKNLREVQPKENNEAGS